MAIETANYQIIIPTAKNTQEAATVAKWTHEGTTLEKSPADILKYFDMGWSVLLQFDNVMVAHAAITYAWPDNWMELGTVITDKNYRQKGLGHMAVNVLLDMAREKYPGHKFMALCNSLSLPIFMKFGGREMDPRELPDAVWGACSQCPKFQEAKKMGKICCDTPVNMTEAGK